MEKNNDYFIYKIIEINFGDPISSMLLTSDHLIIGTMLGQISLFTLSTKNLSILSEINPENISNMSYNKEDNIINISIGDEAILRYKEDKSNVNQINLYQKVMNYSGEVDHSKNCENAFIYLSSHHLFRIQLSQPEEKCLNIIEIESEYEIMNISNRNNFYIGKLPMTNYIVPFCFDGESFAWVEFTGADKRNICIANVLNNYNFLNNNKKELIVPYKKNIDKNFGHVSYLKVLDKHKIFLVHSLNICEIRELNNDFTLLESFKHIGDEVYAVEIYYHNEYLRYRDLEKESSNFFLENNNLEKIVNNESNSKSNENKSNDNNNHSNKNKLMVNGKNNDETISKNDDENEINNNNEDIDKPFEKSKTDFISQKIKINKQNNDKSKDKNKLNMEESNISGNSEYIKSIENNYENNENKNNLNYNYKCDSDIDLSFSIITLDIDGNVNLYQCGKESTLFNLYNFKEISQKMKNDQFFSMGYEYYIKSNLNYFCISTDQGCFVIKKNL